MEEIRVDCYLFPGCPSEEALRRNIESALKTEKVKGIVNFHRIDEEKAVKLGLSGSPSVFIEGEEIEPAETKGFA